MNNRQTIRKLRVTKKTNQGKNCTGEFTVHLSSFLNGVKSKSRARISIRKLREFVARRMNTSIVKIDDRAARYIWSKGVTNVPSRIRLFVERVTENGPKGMQQVAKVQIVAVPRFHGLKSTPFEYPAE